MKSREGSAKANSDFIPVDEVGAFSQYGWLVGSLVRSVLVSSSVVWDGWFGLVWFGLFVCLFVSAFV